ncbi:lipid II flippase MurJ [Sphingobacterium corticis]|uniref:Lipid II flippase MurJ n=1 Tax=Sphingobacterium corticis TaxID=1812823 RepID=A0ABW5NI38_9SPHI
MRKAASLLFLLKFLKAPLSIITLSLTAKYFGVSLDRDIWLLSFSFIIMIDLAIWGPINETFRAKFITIKESEGEIAALEHTRSLLAYIFLGSLLVVLLMEIFAPMIASWIAPNFTEEESKSLTSMLRWVSPILLFNQFVLLGNSILNAYEIFYAPELAAFISQGANILLLILLAPYIGIYSLLFSTALSSFFQIAFLIFYYRKLRIPIFKRQTIKFEHFWFFFLFAVPFFIPYFFGQLNGIIEKSIASTLGTGVVSTIDYARRVPDIINGVLISVVLTIVVPLLTKNFVRKDEDSFNANFMSSFQLGLFLLMAFVAFMATGSMHLNTLLYTSNSISFDAMKDITDLSVLYAGALIAIFLYLLFGMCMISVGKSKLYAVLGAGAQVFIILLNMLLVERVGMYTFPLSIFVAHFVSAIVMAYNYPYDKKQIAVEFIRYVLFGVVLSIGVYYSYASLVYMYTLNNIIFEIIIIGVIQILLMLVMGYLFQIKEFVDLHHKAKAVLTKFTR